MREGIFVASWRLYLLKGRILTEKFSYAEKKKISWKAKNIY